MPDIYIVACSYQVSPEEYIPRLEKFLASLNISYLGVLVSSKVNIPSIAYSKWTYLFSDNENLDFSSYAVGAKFFKDKYTNNAPVLFVNDTLITNHSIYTNLKAIFRIFPLFISLNLPAISGKADKYTTICMRNPWSNLNIYISTYCFLLNPIAVDILLEATNILDDVGLTFDGSIEDELWGLGLDPQFREFIKANLIYKKSPYLWYRLRESKISNSHILAKARAIFLEHYISGETSRLGVILPTNAGPRWGFYIYVSEVFCRVFKSFRLRF